MKNLKQNLKVTSGELTICGVYGVYWIDEYRPNSELLKKWDALLRNEYRPSEILKKWDALLRNEMETEKYLSPFTNEWV